MRPLFFLTLGLVLLGISFRSCAWSNTESFGPEPETAAPYHESVSPHEKSEYPSAQLKPQNPYTVKQAALAQLPSVKKVREEAKQNPHLAPPAVLDGIESFGAMVEMAKKGGTEAQTAVDFFKTCSESEDSATAVRAVCLRHYWDLTGSTANTESLPYRLKRIAARLPTILQPLHK